MIPILYIVIIVIGGLVGGFLGHLFASRRERYKREQLRLRRR